MTKAQAQPFKSVIISDMTSVNVYQNGKFRIQSFRKNHGKEWAQSVCALADGI